MRASLQVAITAALLLVASLSCATAASSDEEIKQQIIQASIASYPGNCPCPYNSAANGSRCGKRSAWSKAGGYAPICYPEEVTPTMIKEWRRQHSG